MDRFYKFVFLSILLCTAPPLLFGESIAEKKQRLSNQATDHIHDDASSLDLEMQKIREQLKEVYARSHALSVQSKTSPEKIEPLLKKSQSLKNDLFEKEQAFRKVSALQNDEEPFSLMHESELSLEQLIIDYASSNYLYVIPSEMAKIQVNLCSSLPIPRASWEEIVELICLQNGIGIKPLNSFVKTLYWNVGNQQTSLKYIAHKPEDLLAIDPFQRVCYVLALEGSELAKVHQFLKKFTNERSTYMQVIDQCIVMVGEAQSILELNKLVDFIREHQQEKTYKLISVEKIPVEELQAILSACFADTSFETGKSETPPLFMLPMKQHLLVMGSQKDLDKADHLLAEIHSQVSDPDQMSVYWYTCKYSDPYELASTLQQVYQMIVQQIDSEEIENAFQPNASPSKAPCNSRQGTIPPICQNTPQLTVNPPPARPPLAPKENAPKETFPNFIVDSKAGVIIMVVKQCHLAKIKELTKKLDIAKKMVQIEVLLFEKKIDDQTQFGLNLFQLGDQSTSTNAGFNWFVDKDKRSSPGILDYFFGRKKTQGVFPAFNFAYNFLISQDDIYVHSNPTVTAVNQTPAVIDLIEEQSVNMGTVEDPRTGTISNTFVRAQYGTFIQITPTVNFGNDEDDCKHYITLDTNITFDTTTSSVDNRPDVNRRHIQNQVRIANGETLILGGLRRKNSEDHVDKVPFLGDIPGLGKLFSFTTLNDRSTEMFIFITPRVVEDPADEFEKIRSVDLKKRPGDSPELLKKLLESKALQKESSYRLSLKQLFKHA